MMLQQLWESTKVRDLPNMNTLVEMATTHATVLCELANTIDVSGKNLSDATEMLDKVKGALKVISKLPAGTAKDKHTTQVLTMFNKIQVLVRNLMDQSKQQEENEELDIDRYMDNHFGKYSTDYNEVDSDRDVQIADKYTKRDDIRWQKELDSIDSDIYGFGPEDDTDSEEDMDDGYDFDSNLNNKSQQMGSDDEFNYDDISEFDFDEDDLKKEENEERMAKRDRRYAREAKRDGAVGYNPRASKIAAMKSANRQRKRDSMYEGQKISFVQYLIETHGIDSRPYNWTIQKIEQEPIIGNAYSDQHLLNAIDEFIVSSKTPMSEKIRAIIKLDEVMGHVVDHPITKKDVIEYLKNR